MSGKLQRRAAAALALAGVLGIVRAADALLLCEDTTGFAAGGPWPRLAAYALLCVPALTLRPKGALRLPARRRGVRAALWLLAAAAAAAAVSFFAPALRGDISVPAGHHMTGGGYTLNLAADLASALCFALLAVLAALCARWMDALETEEAAPKRAFLLALAVPGTLGLAVYVVRWVLLRSASAQRVAAMAEALGATAALVFLVVLAKSLLAASPDGARRTALWGVLAFGCGFCMLLPQALLRAGVPGAMPLPIALVCAAAGLLGGFCALAACEGEAKGR